MLKVLSSMVVRHCTLEVDEYVPVSYRCQDTEADVPLYWVSGNQKTTVLEIGLNPRTGAIYRIAVPGFSKTTVINEKWKPPCDYIVLGIPVCDIHEWKPSDKFSDNFRHEPIDFQTIIGADFVSILFSPETPVSALYVAEPLWAGVDANGMIISLNFRNLSDRDIDCMFLSTPPGTRTKQD